MPLRHLWLALLLAFFAGAAHAQTFPALSGRVVDGANLLDAGQRAAIVSALEEVERRSKHQLVVVTVQGLGGRDIGGYARDLGNHWGVGRKHFNDGILIVVAPVERKVRIAIGKGLERSLTDQEMLEVIKTRMLPRFREGRMAAGILSGTAGVIREIARDGGGA